ncbi:MAG: hypothetical protein D6704_05265 [Nitrospirae bacterium]|nr:MAG: hypothetical protein D6704_05265 [Nitrospirota bacterium]
MPTSEVFIAARLTQVVTYDPGEIRKIELALPETWEIAGKQYAVVDQMRPGTAFLAKPFGLRTGKYRRRMYTRSNCSLTAPRRLETVINDTHQAKADTSPWWQTREVEELYERGGTIEVCLVRHEAEGQLVVYENCHQVEPHNLRLEPDEEWSTMRILALAFSTGITPFLSYLRYMQARDFGKTADRPGAQVVLVASARTPRQLIEHQALLDLAAQCPQHFRYHPVLTREWPDSWEFTTGRVIRMIPAQEGERVDLTPLFALVPDVERYHIRLCGNPTARDQLLAGLRQSGKMPLSFRAEVW